MLSDALNTRPRRWGLLLNSDFFLVINYVFLKNYVTSDGAVSHNVLFYQKLSIVLVNK